jgi:hypothetical protein
VKKHRRKPDWADNVASKIMKKSSTSGPRYYKDLKEELELKVWGSKELVPVWCGTKPIAAALRRAYKRGFLDATKKNA